MTGKRVLTIRQWDVVSCDVVVNLLPPANEVWSKVIFSVACVKNSVHKGGGSASVPAGIPHPPPDQAPPRPGTLLDQVPPRVDTPQTRHPPAQCMLGDTVNKRVVCILLECNLVFYIFSQKYKRSMHEFQRYTHHQSDIFSNTSM